MPSVVFIPTPQKVPNESSARSSRSIGGESLAFIVATPEKAGIETPFSLNDAPRR